MSSESLRAAYREFQQSGGVVDLASRLKLLFTGADRLRYLNGQLTANLLSAKNPSVVPACVTTAKGRLCADVFVSLGPSGILLDADSSLADTLPARMERYIVADDVTMEDATERVAIVHALGIPADRLSSLIPNPAPVPVDRFGLAGFDIFPPFRTDLPPIWEKLTAEFPVLSDDLLEVIRLERGVPRWGFELGEDTLPPEAGLDRTHIDYHKGCYIGQEVISRLKSVGHVNRQLTAFVADAPISLGATITAGDSAQPCGTITSGGWSFALERPIALGYLRRSTARDALFAQPAEAGAEPVAIHARDLPFTT
jgi:folate-binding protein YgfZ